MLDERLLEAFEDAWLSGEKPNLRKTINALAATCANPLPRLLVEELVMIDMECHWRSNSKPTTEQASSSHPPRTLEQYQVDFPELGTNLNLPAQMIAEEYHARQRWGDQPSTKEYRERFPDQWPELRDNLDTIAQDIVQATVSVWHRQNLIHMTHLPARLEIGRQTISEVEPCQEIMTESGRRLIIAPMTARYLSRKHAVCEPSGKDHVRVTCVSSKNPIYIADTKLQTGESQRAPLPLEVDFGDWQVCLAIS